MPHIFGDCPAQPRKTAASRYPPGNEQRVPTCHGRGQAKCRPLVRSAFAAATADRRVPGAPCSTLQVKLPPRPWGRDRQQAAPSCQAPSAAATADRRVHGAPCSTLQVKQPPRPRSLIANMRPLHVKRPDRTDCESQGARRTVLYTSGKLLPRPQAPRSAITTFSGAGARPRRSHGAQVFDCAVRFLSALVQAGESNPAVWAWMAPNGTRTPAGTDPAACPRTLASSAQSPQTRWWQPKSARWRCGFVQ